jgi:hypothetical protein
MQRLENAPEDPGNTSDLPKIVIESGHREVWK